MQPISQTVNVRQSTDPNLPCCHLDLWNHLKTRKIVQFLSGLNKITDHSKCGPVQKNMLTSFI
jgi:hypothetical protein